MLLWHAPIVVTSYRAQTLRHVYMLPTMCWILQLNELLWILYRERREAKERNFALETKSHNQKNTKAHSFAK